MAKIDLAPNVFKNSFPEIKGEDLETFSFVIRRNEDWDGFEIVEPHSGRVRATIAYYQPWNESGPDASVRKACAYYAHLRAACQCPKVKAKHGGDLVNALCREIADLTLKLKVMFEDLFMFNISCADVDSLANDFNELEPNAEKGVECFVENLKKGELVNG
tara:strand:- start:2077 stop:2559 length:483 start_codon:yes stop_codon:yes gene_type:complete